MPGKVPYCEALSQGRGPICLMLSSPLTLAGAAESGQSLQESISLQLGEYGLREGTGFLPSCQVPCRTQGGLLGSQEARSP